MIYTAKQLNKYLTNLTLVGIEDGELQWVGSKEQWNKAEPKKCELCNGDGYYHQVINQEGDTVKVDCICEEESDFTGSTNEDR